MITLDEFTAGAAHAAREAYIARGAARGRQEDLLRSSIVALGILTPAGVDYSAELAEAYRGVAEVADELARSAATTPEELGFRRASSHLRIAAREIEVGSTRRVPVITDAEASARLRRGRHRDSDAPTTRPLMERAGFPPQRVMIETSSDATPIEPIDDLGGES